MAMRVNGNITGSVSSSKANMSGKLTTGIVNISGGTNDGYSKEEVDELLNGKANADHEHYIDSGLKQFTLQEAYNNLNQTKVTQYEVNQTINEYAAPKVHTHDEIQSQIDDLKTSVSNGKTLLASAITDKGVNTLATDTFQTMANNIKEIPQEGGGSNYYEDLYNLRTSNGTNMAGLFARTNGDKLDLSRLDVSKATSLKYMFDNSTIKDLNMSNWDTSNVADMSYMFSYAKISKMDMSNWDTSNVTDMSYMYQYYGGQSITFPFDMSSVRNTSKMFQYCAAPTIDFSNWNGTSITGASEMFSSCQSKLLNLQNLKFPKLTDISRLFYQYGAKELDLSELDISNITNMYYVFGFASSLITLNLTNWNTSNVTNMGSMFYYMSNLEELIIPDWDMTNVTSSSSFMYNVDKLRYIDLSRSNDATIRKILSFLPTKKSTEIGEILIPENTAQDIIDSLVAKYWKPIGPKLVPTSIQLTFNLDELIIGQPYKINTNLVEPWYSNVDFLEFVSSNEDILNIDGTTLIGKTPGTAEVYARVKETQEIVGTLSINVSETDSYPNVLKFKSNGTATGSFFTLKESSVYLEDMEYDSLTGIYRYDVGGPINTIKFCYSGITELIKLNVSNVTDMSGMFNDCSSLTTLDITNWDTSNVTTMSGMFEGCRNLTYLDLSNWDTSNVTTMSGMFEGCRNLTSLDLSNWDTSNVEKLSAMFINCELLSSLNISNFNTSKVETVRQIFSGCRNLTYLDLSNWDTSNVEDIAYAFQDCVSLETLLLNNWDTSNVHDKHTSFSNCPITCNIYVDSEKWTLTESQTGFSGTFIRV